MNTIMYIYICIYMYMMNEKTGSTMDLSQNNVILPWGQSFWILGRPADHTALLEPIPQTSKDFPRQCLAGTGNRSSLGFQIKQ